MTRVHTIDQKALASLNHLTILIIVLIFRFSDNPSFYWCMQPFMYSLAYVFSYSFLFFQNHLFFLTFETYTYNRPPGPGRRAIAVASAPAEAPVPERVCALTESGASLQVAALVLE